MHVSAWELVACNTKALQGPWLMMDACWHGKDIALIILNLDKI
jgi:hypothetical protein